jgi:nucleoside-diphosphate-sugar epimerase
MPDCRLTLVDNLSSSRIDHAWLQGRAEIVIGDFRGFCPSKTGFDRIYHLASQVGSLGILEQSGYVARQITDLAVHAGEMADRCGAPLLYVSSSEIYGKAGLQREEDELSVPVETGTRMEYSLGKLAGENVLRNLSERFGFRLTIARPFNILGENQASRIGFVVPTFFEQALAGRPMTLFYGGSQIRCFCHAEDMAEGMVSIQERGIAGETYNLGNPANLTTILDLAVRIRDLCGSRSQLESTDPRERFGARYLEAPPKHPSIDKIRGHTGWAPHIDLETSLARIHAHYIAQKGGPGHAEDPIRLLEISNRRAQSSA